MPGLLVQALVGLVAVWYLGVAFFAYQQEKGVGWKPNGRIFRMAVFILAMEVLGTVQQVMVWCYYFATLDAVASRQFGHRLMCATFGFVAPALFGPFGAEGVENLPPSGEACVYVSNHQSSVDFALYYALPHAHFKGLCAIAKASIMWMPGFGAMTALCGGIMIKRGKKGTMQQCLEQSADRLSSGICVGLFPQGTRSVPSVEKPALEFKKGFVVMAAKAKTRIVPLTFLYAPDFLSSGRDMSTQGAKVIVHKPVEVPDDSDATIEKVLKAVEATIMAPVLAQIQATAAEKQETKKAK